MRYYALGTDSRFYGPETLQVMQTWLSEERITSDSWIFDTDSDNFFRAEKLSSFGDHLESPVLLPKFTVGPLSSISEADMRELVKISKISTKQEGYTIFKEGETGRSAYIIISGEVRVLLNTSSGMTPIVSLAKGDILGEMVLFGNSLRSATARVFKSSQFLEISMPDLEKCSTRNPGMVARFLLAITKMACTRMRNNNKRFQQAIQNPNR